MNDYIGKIRTYYNRIGLPRIIIFAFLVALMISLPVLKLQTSTLLTQAITRVFMNMTLVLAMVPAIECGIGMNYGLPVGVLSGLFGGMISMEMGLTGFPCFALTLAIGIVVGIITGYLYSLLLNRVAGQESMITTYVGFSITSMMCMVWMSYPIKNAAIRWPMGDGLRSQVSLEEFFGDILNNIWEVEVSSTASIPGGLIVFSLALCLIMELFLRSHTGIMMKTAGSNPIYAKANGINVNKMRSLGTVLSTILGAVGIVVYEQSYGFMEFYETAMKIAFPAAAAILIGGASPKKASVANVLVGTFMFQSVLTLSMPVANALMPESSLAEIVRILVSNGIILYALSKAGGQNG